MTIGVKTDTFDRNVLDEIITSGKHTSRITLANWQFYFNLASAGEEAEAELWAAKKTGGYSLLTVRHAAILAKSLERVNRADFALLSEADQFLEKYTFLAKLQPAYLDFLWEAYTKLRAEQDTQFAKLLEGDDLKKSSPNQPIETTGESSASAGV